MRSDTRRRIEELVRPLYAGLDGVQTFDRVARLRGLVRALAAPAAETSDAPEPPAADPDLLELLLLLHGVVDRLGSLAAGGRLDLFLRGLDLPEERVRRVRAALGRLPDAPQGREEELLHDALLLDAAGVAAAAERLMAAGKKRLPLARALQQLDPGPSPDRYRTPRGAALGADRRRQAQAWIDDLRRHVQEAGGEQIS
jgi:hypothetical protein